MSDTGSDALTRMLTRGRYTVVARSGGSKLRAFLFPLTCLVAGVALHAAFADKMNQLLAAGQASPLEQLAGANQRLSREVEQLKLMQEHDRAALAALQKSYEAQAESLRQASRELSFYRKNAPANAPAN